jgi:hypothetical protein
MLRKPNLTGMVEGAQRNGAAASRFQITKEQAERIRDAERKGGHDQGWFVVLQILCEKREVESKRKQ